MTDEVKAAPERLERLAAVVEIPRVSQDRDIATIRAALEQAERIAGELVAALEREEALQEKLEERSQKLRQMERLYNLAFDNQARFAEQDAKLREKLEQAERVVKVRIGSGSLTKDLLWCECGRGLSLTGKWMFCPTCGGKIDQESYEVARVAAVTNGARLYADPESHEKGRREGLEQAAQIADDRESEWSRDYQMMLVPSEHMLGKAHGAREIAAAIRDIKEETPKLDNEPNRVENVAAKQ